MSRHVPTESTGLTGEWYLGPFGALRVDFNLTPRDIVPRVPPAEAWAVVRDLLTCPTSDPKPLEAPRRWRSHRRLHGRPVFLDGLTVLADADTVFYSAPAFVAKLLETLRDPGCGVLVTDDTGSHADVLVVREAGQVVAVVTLRRLNATGGA